ncbi:MAG: hypothetical protein TYPL_1540 [Candidatus Tyloplasma litorale]|nr:MAG: hypothetical protein TYPL_1540 [Mycoplasmatales bacterium]
MLKVKKQFKHKNKEMVLITSLMEKVKELEAKVKALEGKSGKSTSTTAKKTTSSTTAKKTTSSTAAKKPATKSTSSTKK